MRRTYKFIIVAEISGGPLETAETLDKLAKDHIDTIVDNLDCNDNVIVIEGVVNPESKCRW